MDEYYKLMESLLLKVGLQFESEEEKVVRFVNGLKREIQDVVELYEYFTMTTTKKLGRVKKEKRKEHPPRVFKTTHLGLIHLEFHMILQTFSKVQELVSSNVLSVWVIDRDVTMRKDNDPLEELGVPMTRSRTRKAKEALQQMLYILFEFKPKFQGKKTKVVNCIMAQMEKD